MQEVTQETPSPEALLRDFAAEVDSKLPFRSEGPSGPVIVNATPLVDITRLIIQCAKSEYGLEISNENARVFAKLDSEIFGGSVKVRPAVQIIRQAMTSGTLGPRSTVFEATSGNFGIALGLLTKLGINVVGLVSRKLQNGVLEQMRQAGVKLVNLDVDICPAPGQAMETSLLVAKAVAANLREQLVTLGLGASVFDSSRSEIEQLLARQDVINLAKHLAKIYGGFCPEQYDNEQNLVAHETITGPEIDQQLNTFGHSLREFQVICTFGTGGTSTGISRYAKGKYGERTVHAVFPLANQEVAGIRTKDKAVGLRFYRPELYAGQHEVDFEASRRTLNFFAARGYNVGESSALALYACIQMLNFGAGAKFVVIIADGLQKYREHLQTTAQETKSFEVTIEQARSTLSEYGTILWTHGMFVPKENGIKLVASALGCNQSMMKIATARDVDATLSTQQLPETMRRQLSLKGKVLLVCMVGNTSLNIAKQLAKIGIPAESLKGGIMGLAKREAQQPLELLQLARQ